MPYLTGMGVCPSISTRPHSDDLPITKRRWGLSNAEEGNLFVVFLWPCSFVNSVISQHDASHTFDQGLSAVAGG